MMKRHDHLFFCRNVNDQVFDGISVPEFICRMICCELCPSKIDSKHVSIFRR